MYYYKVVAKTRNGFKSPQSPPSFTLRYVMGEKTEALPKTIGLFAFSTKDDLAAWLGKYGTLEDNEAIVGGFGFPIGKTDLICPYISDSRKMREWYRNPKQWLKPDDNGVLLLHFTPDTEYDKDFNILRTLRKVERG